MSHDLRINLASGYSYGLQRLIVYTDIYISNIIPNQTR